MSGDKISVTVSGGASDPVARARRYAAAWRLRSGLIVDLADAVELARGERDALERQVVADSAWRASLEQELKTARAERDVARAKVAVVTDTSQKYAEALDKVINERDELRGELDWRVKRLREERDKALSELDAVVAALDEANQTLAEERTRAVDYARLDPSSPADLRRVADLLEVLAVDWRPPGGDGWNGWTPSNLRAHATRVAADAAEDELVEKVARAIQQSDNDNRDWDELDEPLRDSYLDNARAAIATVRAEQ